MNLITSPWCPLRTPDGSLRWIGPADLLEDGPPANDPALSDPLLDEVLIEALAAILWLAFRPPDERAWREAWKAGGAAIDRSRLEALAPHFDLLSGARAFQDPTVADLPEQPIAGLLHASPGDQTLKRNKDLGQAGPRGLSPGAAAIALYAMQAHAHAGGPGFRTSVAGGGPLRTVPRMGDTLFRQAWAMVLPRSRHEQGMDAAQASLPDAVALPWVAPPGPKPLGAASHPLLPLFATPRRILLSAPTTEGRCDLTGVVGPLVTRFREGQGGPEYSAGGFAHPWTPWREEMGKVSLPLLAGSRPASFGWRDWSGLVVPRRINDKLSVLPAAAVSAWDRKRLDAAVGRGAPLRVAAYGVRCDQAKVLGFVRSTHAFDVVPEEQAQLFKEAMEAAVAAVERVSLWLTSAVRDVVNDGSKDRRDPVERQARGRSDALWAALEEPGTRFSHAVAQGLDADDFGALTTARAELHRAACRAAVAVFDAATNDAVLQPDTAVKAANARGRLAGSLRGRAGRGLFQLPDSAREGTGLEEASA